LTRSFRAHQLHPKGEVEGLAKLLLGVKKEDRNIRRDSQDSLTCRLGGIGNMKVTTPSGEGERSKGGREHDRIIMNKADCGPHYGVANIVRVGGRRSEGRRQTGRQLKNRDGGFLLRTA